MQQKYSQYSDLDKLRAAEARRTKDSFDAFKQNVQLAYNRNIAGGGRIVHGITSLMDLSNEEFRKLLGYKASNQIAQTRI